MKRNNPFEIQLRHLERMQVINNELISSRSLEEILHQIVEIAAELLNCETVSLLLLDEATNTLRFVVNNLNEDRLFNNPIPMVPMESLVGASFTSGEPIIVDDVQSDPRFYDNIDKWTDRVSRTLLVVPLKFRERKIGGLEGINKKGNQPFDENDAQLLMAFAAQATIAIENARLYRKAQDEIAERIKAEDELLRYRDHLEELVQERTAEVHQLAITDGLTDVYNRRHLIELGKRALLQAQRYDHPLVVMMVDFDHFKSINDTYGHAVGDEALRILTRQIRKDLRSIDILGRYGGDEFVVLMPETNLQMAYQSAERLLANIRNLHINARQTQVDFTASIGVAEMDRARDQTIDTLIARADDAAYTAKKTGRNQVILWQGV